ncbi:MAG: hypothetical protein Q7T26_00430 [Dehalococcoidia bacterium]|nr:hypothetical protein [Dehalococcoidia bacterium]
MDSEQIIPPEEEQLIHTRRTRCSNINRFLWKWVRPGLSHPVLGQNLLVDALSCDESGKDILELEEALKDGASACADFNRIFEGRLPQDSHAADTKILGALAEVEACKWLMAKDFGELRKLNTQDQQTVDFTGQKNSLTFGIEVMCLGVPISVRKKVEPYGRDSINVPGTEETVSVSMFASNEMHSSDMSDEARIEETIRSTILEKLPQLKSFKRTQNVRRMLFISTGRGFIQTGEPIRQDAHTLHLTYGRVLPRAWAALLEDVRRELDGVVLLNAREEWVAPGEFEKQLAA